MGNASKDAKEAADYITTDLWEDGIWNALEHFDLM
jgi:hydroxymethylpyrimidine pyrophosphatase-like HAD family hydrolase